MTAPSPVPGRCLITEAAYEARYNTVYHDADRSGPDRVLLYIVFTIQDRAGTSIDVDNRGGNMQVAPYSVTVKLSQADTLALQKGGVKMQIRAVDTAGNAIASNIMQANLEDVLKGGVIGG